MDDSELLRVCCLSAGDAAAHEVVRGSVTGKCATCHASIWLAPSTVAALRAHDGPAAALCVACFWVAWQNEPGQVLAPTSGQQRELFEHQHRN